MQRILTGLAWLVALLFTGIGLRWLIQPTGSAEALGMVLLDGVGRSSQIADLASFFLAAGLMTAVGLLRRMPVLLLAAGLMIGAAAPFRVLAWAVHGAAFTPEPILVEVVTLVVLLAAARARGVPGEPGD